MIFSVFSRASISARRVRPVKNRSLHRPVLRCVWRPISMFCSTVAYSNSSMFWNVRAMPSDAIWCGGCSVSTLPSNSMLPVVGV